MSLFSQLSNDFFLILIKKNEKNWKEIYLFIKFSVSSLRKNWIDF